MRKKYLTKKINVYFKQKNQKLLHICAHSLAMMCIILYNSLLYKMFSTGYQWYLH
jgi:hypothetical protein